MVASSLKKPAGDRIQVTLMAKLLAAFILIIVPVYVISMMINVWGQNSVKKEQMESSRMDIQLYLSGLEYEFRYALRQQLGLVDNLDMALAASPQGQYDDIDYVKAVNTIRKKLTEIRDSSPFITEVAAYLPSKQAMLSTLKGFTELPQDYAGIKAVVSQGLYPFADYNGSITACIASNTFTSASDDDTYIIGVWFSRVKILPELQKKENADKHLKVALMSTGHGITLVDETDPAVREALAGFAASLADSPVLSGTETLRAGKGTLFVSWAKSTVLQTALLFYTPEESFTGALAGYRLWLAALTALTVGCIFLFSLWMRRIIISPLNKLVGAYRSLEKGDFSVELQYKSHDEFGILYERSNKMFRRLGTLIEQEYEQRIHAREAELKQLQYQINPHFLYNSILIIGNLIKMTDYECAHKLAFHLGNYFQYLTKGADFVPLGREAAHARDYIEIQSIRFTGRFTCQFEEIPEDMLSLEVPRLILQPIIENTFKYGLANTVSGGILRIGTSAGEGLFRILIEDNGQDLADEKIRALSEMAGGGTQIAESTGLMNVHRRIQIHFGPESGLAFSRSGLGGLRVEIRIVKGAPDVHAVDR